MGYGGSLLRVKAVEKGMCRGGGHGFQGRRYHRQRSVHRMVA